MFAKILFNRYMYFVCGALFACVILFNTSFKHLDTAESVEIKSVVHFKVSKNCGFVHLWSKQYLDVK